MRDASPNRRAAPNHSAQIGIPLGQSGGTALLVQPRAAAYVRRDHPRSDLPAPRALRQLRGQRPSALLHPGPGCASATGISLSASMIPCSSFPSRVSSSFARGPVEPPPPPCAQSEECFCTRSNRNIHPEFEVRPMLAPPLHDRADEIFRHRDHIISSATQSRLHHPELGQMPPGLALLRPKRGPKQYTFPNAMHAASA